MPLTRHYHKSYARRTSRQSGDNGRYPQTRNQTPDLTQTHRRLPANAPEVGHWSWGHPGARVYTDTAASYQRLGENFLHEIRNHAIAYVDGRIHTNGMENFWSLLKRALRGTYVAVDPDHLEAYVDEQVFRFNYRHESDWQRFDRLMRMVVGKRLTYTQLTAGKVR